jgi:phage-related protein
MSLNSDYQKLEPGNTVRFEVDGTSFGVGEMLRFHNTISRTLRRNIGCWW